MLKMIATTDLKEGKYSRIRNDTWEEISAVHLAGHVYSYRSDMCNSQAALEEHRRWRLNTYYERYLLSTDFSW